MLRTGGETEIQLLSLFIAYQPGGFTKNAVVLLSVMVAVGQLMPLQIRLYLMPQPTRLIDLVLMECLYEQLR